MISNGQRKNPVTLLWKRLSIAGLFICVAFSLWAVHGVYRKEKDSREQRALSEVHLHDISDRQVALTASIQALETIRGREQALRNAYTVGKEGEGLIVIVQQAPEQSVQTATSTPLQWLHSIFGR